tara:strand:+ start:1768 stop:2997 length:1230 start_codon:yes stop_codon:yes gene_type:complete
MSWDTIKLGDYIETLTDYHANGAYKKLKANVELKYKSDYALMIRTLNFERNNFNSNLIWVNETEYNFLSKSKVYPDDIIMNKIANAGSVYIMPNLNRPVSLAMNLFLIRFKELDQKFMYYLMKTNELYIKSFANGVATQSITKDAVRNLEFEIPSKTTQKRIADILSAYDDLIENNLKRINLLEQSAQNIYKEWFVNLRFPGHENTAINEETGLPVGWEKLTIEEYTKVASRGPSLNYKIDKGFPVLNQSCIRNGEIELDKVRIAEKLKENKEHCYLQINDILINSMGQGTLGRVSKNNSISEKFIIHNCITLLRAKDDYSQTLLYHFISAKEKYFISISQGSTGQTTLKLSLIKELILNAPSKTLMNSFDDIVLPMWSQIGKLKTQNQKLKAARDILLPRLMNRTIEV